MAHAASRPRMLPPATAAFTDREEVLAWLGALLDEEGLAPGAPTIAVLTGPGGMGKTATAVRGAIELLDRFPDGALFADLEGASAGTALPPSDVLVHRRSSAVSVRTRTDGPTCRVPRPCWNTTSAAP
ncbi:hypothetical protein [Streptomyces sasae]|uniref:hypothetical protein n=1 Tax=Streptomyces sasae TaxID=1266772 RepID=UPI00293037AC|nr:hypothetical protein [Streptomyces sasae]